MGRSPDRTVLVVEDDKDDIFLLQHASKKAGMTGRMTFAENGKHAVELLQALQAQPVAGSHAPELILLDLNMPVMNGLDFLRWLRNEPAWKKVPVIILTTSEDPRDVSSAYELGANAYTVKPNNPSELSDILKAVQHFWLTYNRVAEPGSGDVTGV